MTVEPTPETTEPDGGATVAEPTDTPDEAAEKPKKLNQTVEIHDVGPCKKHIKVTVDRSAIDGLMDAKYSELVVDTPVSGFRPGKAPRRIIERRFAKDVKEQVRGEVLLQSLEQLAEEHDLSPLSPPAIDPAKLQIPDQGPFVFEFEVEVRPQFELPNYKGLRLRRPVHTFTEEEVHREQRRLLAPYGQIVPKPEGNAQDGDILVVDMVTRFGDRVISQLKEFQIRVDSRLAFKDGVAERFGEQVQGTNPGDSRVIDIKLSDGVAEPGLRGQTVQATLDIKDVKTIRLPELTPEFLRRFGVQTPEQLREALHVALQRRLEYLQRQAAREQVLAHIASAADWELPADLLRRQARKAMSRRIMEMRASGMPEDEIRARQRGLQQDILRSTELALKEHFVLQKLAEVEKLEVKDEDIDDEIERIAIQNDDSPRRVRARLEKDDLMEALAIELLERKALDLVLQHADYEDVPVGQQVPSAGTTVEEQAVPGEMHDPTAAPAEAAEQPAPGPS
jgi:trigger factor